MEACQSRSKTLRTIAGTRIREKQTGGRFMIQTATTDGEQRWYFKSKITKLTQKLANNSTWLLIYAGTLIP